MRICLVVEGAYPYVQGGVSSWIQALVKRLPDYEFVVQTIAASRSDSGKFKYEAPPNMTAIHESFLQEEDRLVQGRRKKRFSAKERDALRSLIFHEDEQWEVIFDLFQDHNLSVNDILMGEEFFRTVREYYNAKYGRVVFTDFLWTMRSVFLPIFLVLKNRFVKADLYHAVSTGYAGIVASCAAYRNQRPLLLTEHGVYTREREEEIIRASWTKGIYKDLWIEHFYMLSRCIYERADKVYSLFDRAVALQIEIGCPEEKASAIHNGVDIQGFSNLVQKDPDDPWINIGAVVRVTPIKDIKTMINAFHLAKAEMPALKLFIIGGTEEDPYYYQECLGLIEMLGTKDIVFTGHVNTKDYIGKMDIALLSSISEGQPLSLLEAMAANKPCISTRVGDCYDMLKAGDDDERAGIVVPVMNVGEMAQAILTLARDEPLRKRMGDRGRKIAETEYEGSQFISSYRAAYEELHAARLAGTWQPYA